MSVWHTCSPKKPKRVFGNPSIGNNKKEKHWGFGSKFYAYTPKMRKTKTKPYIEVENAKQLLEVLEKIKDKVDLEDWGVGIEDC